MGIETVMLVVVVIFIVANIYVESKRIHEREKIIKEFIEGQNLDTKEDIIRDIEEGK